MASLGAAGGAASQGAARLLVLLALGARAGSAKFLPPSRVQATPAVPESEPSHPRCSFSVSRLVRRRLEDELSKATSRAGAASWPAGCPLDPSRDLFDAEWRRPEWQRANETPSGSTCFADYCELFGVCHGADAGLHGSEAECDGAAVAQARRRCDDAVTKCFPLEDKATRRLHAQYSRHWCQVLDCRVREERRKGHEAAPLPLVGILAVLVPVCTAGLAGLVLGVEHSDQILASLVDHGLATPHFVRGCLQARESLRMSVGMERTKGF